MDTFSGALHVVCGASGDLTRVAGLFFSVTRPPVKQGFRGITDRLMPVSLPWRGRTGNGMHYLFPPPSIHERRTVRADNKQEKQEEKKEKKGKTIYIICL